MICTAQILISLIKLNWIPGSERYQVLLLTRINNCLKTRLVRIANSGGDSFALIPRVWSESEARVRRRPKPTGRRADHTRTNFGKWSLKWQGHCHLSEDCPTNLRLLTQFEVDNIYYFHFLWILIAIKQLFCLHHLPFPFILKRREVQKIGKWEVVWPWVAISGLWDLLFKLSGVDDLDSEVLKPWLSVIFNIHGFPLIHDIKFRIFI